MCWREPLFCKLILSSFYVESFNPVTAYASIHSLCSTHLAFQHTLYTQLRNYQVF